eukprot:CAMPEP_0181170770 /NCGR_PEP_ID=MMETSP1096-20121128/1545_1 /TAXON_ID=156174 ORGANISM="Chrysochromulina ericina, Strain CCMP281" /NCGR_SAMPLE_ID=MMETSP1096 /ASSEMBLY_ACC=CAM_ASM_000453 /LENGTH=55 /DNA_ID=CAMNT_0023258357 /DNA_START=736 /DNA_END=899 /DNA_ORIENTATION=-
MGHSGTKFGRQTPHPPTDVSTSPRAAGATPIPTGVNRNTSVPDNSPSCQSPSATA